MRPNLRQAVKRLLPRRALAVVSSNRWWSFLRECNRHNGMREVCDRLVACYGTTVRNGPFAGLRFTHESLRITCNTHELLGTYEKELHPWFYALRGRLYDRVLDIGSAEGYYAVGMALRVNSPVDAFETASLPRRLCRSMAELNGIPDLVRIHSYCSQKTLLALHGLRCFILSDCQGFEVSLFAGNVIAALANSDLIIELHDNPGLGATTRQILERRFEATHRMQVVRFQPRTLSDLPEPRIALGDSAIRAISEEGRTPDEEWLVATPLNAVRTL